MMLTVSALIATALSYCAQQPSMRMIETSTWFARQMASERPAAIKILGGQSRGTSVLIVDSDQLGFLAARSHALTGRCGGFIDVTNESPDAQIDVADEIRRMPLALPNLDRPRNEIVEALKEVKSENISSFVKEYSGRFATRDSRSDEGKSAPAWLKEQWQQMAQRYGRDDVSVELIAPPRGYEQPSVRITIAGKDRDLPIVVLGGHLDSINSRAFMGGQAPGADDDASGIATLTEAYRVILASHLRPNATVQIFGYAAEELGLLGSRAIAERYQQSQAKVRGVLQLDMTAWPSDAHAVTFITDNVDEDLTRWTEQLYGMYVGGEVKHERCGYGCSDHASWTRYGFASVMPFESMMSQMNPRIHSEDDLWDNQLDADYAALFARLAYAFAAELSR